MGVAILSVVSCYRNWNKLRPCGPPWLVCEFTGLPTYRGTEADKGHTLSLPGCRFHVVALSLMGWGDFLVGLSMREALDFEGVLS